MRGVEQITEQTVLIEPPGASITSALRIVDVEGRQRFIKSKSTCPDETRGLYLSLLKLAFWMRSIANNVEFNGSMTNEPFYAM